MRAARMLTVAACVGVAGIATAADERPPRNSAPAAPNEREFDRERRQAALSLTAQLGDPRFEIREQATKMLEQAGIEAVEPLAAAAAGDNLEVTCRAFRVLAAFYEAADDATFDAVELALEQLEQSTNRAASRRAWAMLESGDFPPSQEHKKGRDRRWKRAILRLRAQGAIVKQAESDKLGKEIIDVPAEENPLPIVILAESWKGGAAGLVDIKRMSARFPLPIVYVVAEAANIPADRIDDLQRARPRMKIENRGAAMLGISGNADSPCRVTRVEPNSAAAKAGILENDMIVKYDGEELSNFEQLIKITKRHKVGDKIEIEVNRDGTKINVEAQLTGWTLSKPATEMK